jgi:hypothetical protein
MPDADPWADLADDIRRGRAAETTEVWQARAAKAETEAEAEHRDRGALMRVLAAQTGETARLRGACEAAAAMLREDRPKAALALLEETARV